MKKQQQFLDVIDRDEAERRFRNAIRYEPLGEETVGLSESLGRVLARDVIARRDVPLFDRSNYDGFAVQAADTYGATEESPRQLLVLDEVIMTSRVPNRQVRSGTAIPIATGGMLPRGADAVVMVEDTDSDEQSLWVRQAVAPGFGVSFAGTDITVGETVLRQGELLTSRETGVLAAMGESHAHVFLRPRVGIISTGDEMIEPGQPIRPPEVYDSNSRILADAVVESGGDATLLGIVADDRAKLKATLMCALRTCDVVLLSGGTSKGAGDLSYRVVGSETSPGIVAHGVALKPGKPVCLASHHGKPVAVLPGFPTSAIFTFHEFLAPVIRRLAGRDDRPTDTVQARMAIPVRSQIGRTEYLLVTLVPAADSDDDDSPLLAYPMGSGSGSVTTFSRADGFVTAGRHEEILQPFQPVTVQLLARNLHAADLIVIGSHCVGLDYLLGLLQRRYFHTKFLAVGSTAGLQAARHGQCDVAGIHLLDPETGLYNKPFLTEGVELIPGYRRLQGIVYRSGDERFEGATLERVLETVTCDAECRMANRNQGSGTRLLMDRLLRGAEPPGYVVQPSNHNAVANAVLQGRADWGMAIESVARQAGLGFLPVMEEEYDFVVPCGRADRPAVLELKQLLGQAEVRAHLARLGCRCVGGPETT